MSSCVGYTSAAAELLSSDRGHGDHAADYPIWHAGAHLHITDELCALQGPVPLRRCLHDCFQVIPSLSPAQWWIYSYLSEHTGLRRGIGASRDWQLLIGLQSWQRDRCQGLREEVGRAPCVQTCSCHGYCGFRPSSTCRWQHCTLSDWHQAECRVGFRVFSAHLRFTSESSGRCSSFSSHVSQEEVSCKHKWNSTSVSLLIFTIKKCFSLFKPHENWNRSESEVSICCKNTAMKCLSWSKPVAIIYCSNRLEEGSFFSPGTKACLRFKLRSTNHLHLLRLHFLFPFFLFFLFRSIHMCQHPHQIEQEK